MASLFSSIAVMLLIFTSAYAALIDDLEDGTHKDTNHAQIKIDEDQPPPKEQLKENNASKTGETIDSTKSVMVKRSADYCKDYGLDGIFCVDTFDNFPEDIPNSRPVFKLHTRSYRNGENMQFSTGLHSGFKSGQPIKIIIHGFWDTGSEPWITGMKNNLLHVGDFNVIVVDWRDAAFPDKSKVKWIEYDRASSNTRIIASRVKRLLGFILEQHSSSAINDVHLIGHSLGAQISGMVGKWVQRDLVCGNVPCKVSRITALDPARPNFLRKAHGAPESIPGRFCVSKEDADFVDVIHTDSTEASDEVRRFSSILSELGIYQHLGHADFYPNGGTKQTGCSHIPWTDYDYGCDHRRAYELFSASINSSCNFDTKQCTTYNPARGSCRDCTPPNCNRMGYFATKLPTPTFMDNNIYYLETTEKYPFC